LERHALAGPLLQGVAKGGNGLYLRHRPVERRSLAARERLEAETDPVMILGRRKLVRKWNEEIRMFEAVVRAESRIACGNFAAAEAAWREFVEWMDRPDRKAFDETG
jgi:hypothetical protein